MTLQKDKHEAMAMAFLTGQSSPEEVVAHHELFKSDSAYRDCVRELELWLAPLNEGVEDKLPPEGLLDDIMAGIDTDIAPIPLPPQAANDRYPSRWKGLAIASSFIAIAAIGSHFVGSSSQPPLQDETPALMALLSDSTQPQLAAIVYNPQTNKVVARFSNVTIPDENDLELWLIRENGPGPVSLGVMSNAKEGDQIEFEIPVELSSQTDLLAISLEPLGGSGTTAGPQGPILFTGAVGQL